jgi:hypothetical protein
MEEELLDMCQSCKHSNNGESCGRCEDVEEDVDELDHDMLVNKLTNE